MAASSSASAWGQGSSAELAEDYNAKLPVAGAAEFQERFLARSLSAETLAPKAAGVKSAGAAGRSFWPTPTDAEPAAVCPVATHGQYECDSILVPTVTSKAEAQTRYLLGLGPAPAVSPSYQGSGEEGGFSPSDLRSAYKLGSDGGEGQTVAIVDAYDDPKAESDLATYRKTYGLSPCTSENGCFEKVNQTGESTGYPSADTGWAVEISLDLDMVSAVCPQCHILLVEANSNEMRDLGPAVEEAAELGASEISDSWSGEESPEETSFDHYFDHPGVPVLFASGDEGYSVQYPAASPYVIAVGGTSLKKAANARGWSETAWSGAGSGCSAYEPKPTWQKDEGCPHRTVADVSAVADPSTPVSMYDSYNEGGWLLAGGTSVATPLLAGVEALSSSAVRSAGPSAIYDAGEGGELFDVTEGENGNCGTYLCQAEVGYDGPTGWGTPDGPLSLPVAITEAATAASAGKMTLHGSVDPEGMPTEYHFEYGETTSYGTSVPIAAASAGSGTEYVRVSQPIEGIKAQTTYHYRIVATNAGGTFDGVDRTFGTTPPTVTGRPASKIRGGKATLNATVNPEGLATSYYFEYGTSSSYGSKMPLRNVALGSGTTNVAVSAAISGLVGDTIYHFRVVAKNVAGMAYGEDGTFTAKPSEWGAQVLAQPANSSDEQKGESVSCVQADACVAAGAYWSLGVHTYVTLAEAWNGESWSVMRTPNPPGLDEGYRDDRYALLSSVSCVSESDCVAVGYYRGAGEAVEPLAERRDSNEWTMMPPAVPSGAAAGWLKGVSCASSTQCTAVGYYETSAGVKEALAELWDDSEWSIQPTPKPTGASGARLTGVSCASSTQCTAVGSYEASSGADETLAERWDGSEWSIQTTANPTGTKASNSLSDVSCASAADCMAVGAHLYKATSATWTETPLAENWDGSEWSVLSIPVKSSKNTSSKLVGVSCASASACTAVGADFKKVGGIQPLGERWNGTQWIHLKTVVLEEPHGWWHESWLTGISCAQADACTAVGSNLSAPPEELSLSVGFAEQEFIPPYRGAPAVTGLSTPSGLPDGPVGGGTTVTLTGRRFTGASAVDFGSTPASSFTVVSDSEIKATSPAGSDSTGWVDVTVLAPEGRSAVNSNDQFNYVPSVTAISPTAGPVAGGTPVTITGTGFESDGGVQFVEVGGTGEDLTSLNIVSDTTATAVMPASTAGAAYLVFGMNGTAGQSQPGRALSPAFFLYGEEGGAG